MSTILLEKLDSFSDYKFDKNKYQIWQEKKNADIEQFLNILNILDCNHIAYKLVKNSKIMIQKLKT